MARTAVVIFNLGGPDNAAAVEPFLFNLFYDPFIMRQPTPVRWLLAKLISKRRAPVAQEIYAQIGGRSPILEETQNQAAALAEALGDDQEYRIFVAMRYWRPFVEDCIAKIKPFDPERIVLLPLYPQFSTTTTESFLSVWKTAALKADLDLPTASICCYPTEAGLVEVIADRTKAEIDKLSATTPVRVLFSAHGLPKKFVAAGDPYQAQVEMTVAAVVEKMALADLDRVICYQSRVGPVEWLRPYTDDEIKRCGNENKAVIVVPVAFVSEHSETLVELDIEYAALARDSGVPEYRRVPTVGIQQSFIDGLARLVRRATFSGIESGAGGRQCPSDYAACPLKPGIMVAG